MANNRQPITEEERLTQIENAADCLDQERLQGLDRLKTLQTIKSISLEREQKRLTQKYGTNHPRTQKVMRQLTYNQGLQRELDQEIERAKIQVPRIDQKTWLINGRVLTRERQGIAGLTVSLFNEKQRWIRELGFTCTDERGYFALDYSSQTSSPKPSRLSPSQPLILSVTNAEQQILHQEQRPLLIKPGVIDYREIILNPNQEPKTPPEPEQSTQPPTPPSKPVLDGSVLWFQRDSVKLRQDDELDSVALLRLTLKRIQKYIEKLKNQAQIVLRGYASTEGDEQDNLRLSQRRAEAVRTQLVEAGIPEDQLFVEAGGEDNTYPTLALNRRVEIKLLAKPDQERD